MSFQSCLMSGSIALASVFSLAGCALPLERVVTQSVVGGTLPAREAAARAAAHATQCLIGTRPKALCEADRRAAEAANGNAGRLAEPRQPSR